ncbi:MAG TPA: MarR family winged helix-turn-helix transcriptional regulator [Clostridia bacterium]|nr:MarR family winged helix-turn-helix transcriptional regulator [Clostridia bacterium]
MTEKEKINFWGEFMTTLHKNLHKYLKYKLKDIELKKEEVHFLHYISENDSVEQNTLSQCFNVDKSTTTRRVKKLIKHGYIKRKLNKDDHRKYMLFSTQKGKELSKDILDLFKVWNNEITKEITQEEIIFFKSISNKIIKNANNLIERMYENE